MKRTTTSQTYTVEEAARLLGIGRNNCYEAAKRGEIPAIRIGKRILIARAGLERLMAEGAAASATTTKTDRPVPDFPLRRTAI